VGNQSQVPTARERQYASLIHSSIMGPGHHGSRATRGRGPMRLNATELLFRAAALLEQLSFSLFRVRLTAAAVFALELHRESDSMKFHRKAKTR